MYGDNHFDISELNHFQVQKKVDMSRKRQLSFHERPASPRTKITRLDEKISSNCALGAHVQSTRSTESFDRKYDPVRTTTFLKFPEQLNDANGSARIVTPLFQAKALQTTQASNDVVLQKWPENTPTWPTTALSYNVTNKCRSPITESYSPVRYKVEYKGSTNPGDYRGLPVNTNKEINSHLSKGRKAFWLKCALSGCHYLYDVETMQQHNIDTGFRRSIRFLHAEPESVIDLTAEPVPLIRFTSNESIDSVCQLPSIRNDIDDFMQRNGTKRQDDSEVRGLQQLLRHDQAINICGPAFEGEWLCGEIANRKLLEIRRLQLQGSWLISEMLKLPENQQLFDPEPISPNDSRFPIEHIKNLRCGSLTVHPVRETRTWKRNRSHFDLLHTEEKDFFSIYKEADTPLQLVHFGWHGAPAESIKGILECGFLSVPTARVGRCYGHGIYLATDKFAIYSKRDRFSVPDAGGFKYLLLCEVLPGTVEVSKKDQTHPSNELSHSGVDRMPDPIMHVFYTYDMNVRISPKFVVCIHPKVTEDILSQVQNE